MSNYQLKVNVSLTDFPLFIPRDLIFKELKEAGADGIEVVLGIKTYYHFNHLLSLSRKYNLPLFSLHQPIWSGLGLYFDRKFIKYVPKTLGKSITFHPLPRDPFYSKRLRDYFHSLAKIKNDYNFEILLENLPQNYTNNFGFMNRFFSSSPDSQDFLKLLQVAKEFDFKLTFDTSHAALVQPHRESYFEKIFSRIGNIHLSSFKEKKTHLPLDMGIFDTKGFLSYLRRKNYQGLVTLEIYYPQLVSLKTIDFKAIRKSIKIVKEIWQE